MPAARSLAPLTTPPVPAVAGVSLVPSTVYVRLKDASHTGGTDAQRTVEARFSLNNQEGPNLADGGIAWRLSGGVSYTRFFNLGSLVRLSVRGGVDSAQPFVMLSLEARYGVARGAFVNAR